jgi:hypothetical protein
MAVRKKTARRMNELNTLHHNLARGIYSAVTLKHLSHMHPFMKALALASETEVV